MADEEVRISKDPSQEKVELTVKTYTKYFLDQNLWKYALFCMLPAALFRNFYQIKQQQGSVKWVESMHDSDKMYSQVYDYVYLAFLNLFVTLASSHIGTVMRYFTKDQNHE